MDGYARVRLSRRIYFRAFFHGTGPGMTDIMLDLATRKTLKTHGLSGAALGQPSAATSAILWHTTVTAPSRGRRVCQQRGALSSIQVSPSPHSGQSELWSPSPAEYMQICPSIIPILANSSGILPVDVLIPRLHNRPAYMNTPQIRSHIRAIQTLQDVLFTRTPTPTTPLPKLSRDRSLRIRSFRT